MAPIAFLQSRCTDYPYVGWKLRAIEDEKAILDIKTMRITLVFEVGPKYMKLIDNTDPVLKDIIEKEFAPGDLLIELGKCGIHLMPIDDDAKIGNINVKNRQTEERAIIDICSTVNAFSFRSAKWNREMNSEKVAVKFRENLEFDREFFEDHENEWRYLQWWPNKVAFCKCVDTEPELDDSIPKGHEVSFSFHDSQTHAMLTIALKNSVTEDAIQRASFLGYVEFIETLQQVFRLTRLLAFT